MNNIKRLAENDPFLIELKLWLYLVDENDVMELANALKNNTHLKKLKLNGSSVTNVNIKYNEIKQIADALRVNTKLELLSISYCGIDVNGAKEIADALKFNTTLRVLNIDNNQIGDEGASEFADTLRVNNSLQEITLDNNKINFFSVCHSEFVEALQHNYVLEKLTGINGVDDLLIEENRKLRKRFSITKSSKK